MNKTELHIPDPKKLLPRKQLVADDVKTGNAASWVEYSSYAIHRPYLSFNNPEIKRIDFLLIDCDHENYDYRPGTFPTPLVITISKDSGRHHHVYQLKTPVLTGVGARLAPQKLFAAVQHAFVYQLDGDEAYTGRLTKNPFYDPSNRKDEATFKLSSPNSPLRTGWHTIWYPDAPPLDLSAASIWCDMETTSFANPSRSRPDPRTGLGRNIALFDYVRYWAYDNWSDNDEEAHAVAYEYNSTFTPPLPINEVKATVKSICKFMRNCYRPRKMKPLKRQSSKERIELIIHAENKLFEDSKRIPTQKEISQLTQIPLRSTQRILKHMADNDISNSISLRNSP